MAETPILLLASASEARAGLLARAGLVCLSRPASVDEALIKSRMRASGAPVEAVTMALALAKADAAALASPGALVIGADQILVCGDRWYDKPADRAGARMQLLSLKGRSHDLVTSAVVVRGGDRLWQHTARATLAMCDFSDPFLDAYLDAVGDAAHGSVGAYQLEGRGAQLFRHVKGDFFTILGLPLLPLLDFLRREGVLPS